MGLLIQAEQMNTSLNEDPMSIQQFLSQSSHNSIYKSFSSLIWSKQLVGDLEESKEEDSNSQQIESVFQKSITHFEQGLKSCLSKYMAVLAGETKKRQALYS